MQGILSIVQGSCKDHCIWSGNPIKTQHWVAFAMIPTIQPNPAQVATMMQPSSAGSNHDATMQRRWQP